MIGIAPLRSRLERLGSTVTSQVWRLGYASRFLVYLVMHSGTALRRFRLTIAEIYFAGVLSLIIILVSGLFVGMVLALQGYETLQRFGASESLGVLVALSLVRELGPVVAGLLFAGVFLAAVLAGRVGGSGSEDRPLHSAWRLSIIADWSRNGRANSTICALSSRCRSAQSAICSDM